MTMGFINTEGKYRLLTSPVKINAQNCIDITFSSVFVSESIDLVDYLGIDYIMFD